MTLGGQARVPRSEASGPFGPAVGRIPTDPFGVTRESPAAPAKRHLRSQGGVDRPRPASRDAAVTA